MDVIESKTFADRKDEIVLEAFEMFNSEMLMAVFLNAKGFRQAYVGIPLANSMSHERCILEHIVMDSKEDFSYIKPNSMMDELAEELTNVKAAYLWTGFDTGHLRDRPDYAAVEAAFGEKAAESIPTYYECFNPIRDAADCITELKTVAQKIVLRQKDSEIIMRNSNLLHIMTDKPSPLLNGDFVLEMGDSSQTVWSETELMLRNAILRQTELYDDHYHPYHDSFFGDADEPPFVLDVTVTDTGNVYAELFLQMPGKPYLTEPILFTLDEQRALIGIYQKESKHTQANKLMNEKNKQVNEHIR